MTKFHPILFSTPMIQAILDGTKTQTRRVVKLPNYHPSLIEKQKKVLTIKDMILYDGNDENIGTIKSHYNVGDVLWGRENFYTAENFDNWKPGMLSSIKAEVFFQADIQNFDISSPLHRGKIRPNIFLPFDYCRIFLKIKSIRVERLQDISEEDAKKEGVKLLPNGSYRNYHEEETEQNYMFTNLAKVSFETLWESIYSEESWNFNPYVFVYEYERIEKPLDFIV